MIQKRQFDLIKIIFQYEINLMKGNQSKSRIIAYEFFSLTNFPAVTFSVLSAGAVT